MMREDWSEIPYKDAVVKISTSKQKLKQKEYLDEGSIAVVDQGQENIGGYTNDESRILDCELPVIVFGDHTKIVKIISFPFAPGADGTKVLQPKKFVDAKLLAYFTKILVHKISDKGYARHYQHVEKENIQVPPLPEQRAIVAKIEELFSSLDSGIADLQKAQAQLKVFRQAVLKKAFEGELTKEWRTKQTNLPSAKELLTQIKDERENHYNQQLEHWQKAVKTWEENGKEGKKPAKPRLRAELIESHENIHSLPSSWCWAKLGNIAIKISDGPFGSNLKTADYVDSGVQVIRLENIGNLIFKSSKTSFITPAKYETIKNHTVYPKDIIFSSFIAEQISVVSIPDSIKKAVNKADCFCVRFNELVSFEYHEYFLSTRTTYNQLVNEVHGATRPRINTTQLKEVLVPLCSLLEQHQIVQEIESRLSVCDKVEESILENLEKAKALRQSILKKAFEGKLLTEQELAACKAAPDYEPASVLLARIERSRNERIKESKN